MEKFLPDSYLKIILNSQGVHFWRNFYIKKGDRKEDILENGDLSCAFFVSTILLIFGLIDKVHFTVEGTFKAMKQKGWREIKKLKPGSVLIWEKQKGHKHIGFFIGKNSTISNLAKSKTPQRHHLTFCKTKKGQPIRKIEKILWHKKLK